ncbi:hypothetical protein [Kibdelosporangium aridum]|uniref:hypothetical protein n=1 Tax=Kibdelosporangium aridum TaxID=2030 RepID=UPI00068987A3
MTSRRRALLLVTGILALQVFLAAPAHAATGCIPNPERVTSGFVATIDIPRPSHGQPGSWYGTYAYAGTRWNTYTYDNITLFCGTPMAQTDTWLGNQLFNVGKALVAGTNAVWYLLVWGDDSGPVFSNFDKGLPSGAKSIYDNAFIPLLSLVLVLAVVWMLFKTLKGALAHIATKLLWILCAFWVAASAYLMPTAYTSFLDTILTEELREIQGAVLRANGYDETHGMPELLYDNVIKKTWLEGEFGASDSPLARDQGPRLLDAQAWTKFDHTENVTQADLDRKRATFDDVANTVRDTDAEGHFTGEHSGRLGTGLLGMVRGLCFAYFPFMALVGQLVGMLILRLVVLGAPVLGLAMIVYHRAAPGIARGLGKALSACILLAVGSTGYLWALPAVLNGVKTPLLQLLIMIVITILAIVLIRPVRQITGMVGGIVQAAGLNYATQPLASSWAFRTWRRHRRWNKRHKQLLHAVGGKHQPSSAPSPQNHEPSAPPPPEAPSGQRRHRPEAGAPQRATSTRIPMPSARQHSPAERLGELGPRVFFHGPRVIYQGPATDPQQQQPKQIPPPPSKPSPQPTVIVTSADQDAAAPEVRSDPDTEPPIRIPDHAPPNEPTEELIVPSEYEKHAHDNEPAPPRINPSPPVIEIYHPSTDQVLPHPAQDTNSSRPEGEDRGDTDADPI